MPAALLDSYENFTAHLEDREFFGTKLGLERIRRLLTRLGNPEERFPSIHIAGTNGKGSTAAMIAQVLAEAEYKVGLYTSPHLVDFCERVQIITHPPAPSLTLREGVQGNPPLSVRGGSREFWLSREGALSYARQIREVEEEPLTFFELATAIAFLYFAEEKVDLAIVETGLGGRLDATNVVTPLVSVITTIGLDHMQYLGDTIEKIAFEKAGIIKPGVPVIVGDLPEEAMGIVEKVAADERVLPLLTPTRRHRPPEADCWRSVGGPQSGHPFVSQPLSPRPPPVAPPPPATIGLPGDHQLHNATLAVTVIEELRRQGWKIPEEAVRLGLADVRWPGRLETVQESPWVILDGAHNPQAMRAAREFLEPRLAGRRLKVIFGAMVDKDLAGLLAEIAPITDEFIFTTPPMKRAAAPSVLAELATDLGKRGRVTASVEEAVRIGRESLAGNEAVLVTGSLFVVGEARRMLIPPS